MILVRDCANNVDEWHRIYSVPDTWLVIHLGLWYCSFPHTTKQVKAFYEGKNEDKNEMRISHSIKYQQNWIFKDSREKGRQRQPSKMLKQINWNRWFVTICRIFINPDAPRLMGKRSYLNQPTQAQLVLYLYFRMALCLFVCQIVIRATEYIA